MHETSNLGDLKARIARRQREERERSAELEAVKKRIQAATASHLRQHEEWLAGELRKSRTAQSRLLREHVERSSGSASAALSTIERDTAAALARKDAMLKRSWLRPLTIGLSLFLGVLLGSWGLTQWLSSEIESLIARKIQLEVGIELQEETLARLEGRTWGIRLHEGDKGRYVVLPWDAELDTRWTIGGRPSVRFSSK